MVASWTELSMIPQQCVCGTPDAVCTDFVVKVGRAAFTRVAFGVHPLANFAEILRPRGYREYEASLYLEHAYKSDAKGHFPMEPSFLLVQ